MHSRRSHITLIKKNENMKRIGRLPWEAIIWLSGLVALAIFKPENDAHFTLCPLNNLGFDFCPGSGLGRSISFFFHGEVYQSLKTHPLGIFAVTVLSFRTF